MFFHYFLRFPTEGIYYSQKKIYKHTHKGSEKYLHTHSFLWGLCHSFSLAWHRCITDGWHVWMPEIEYNTRYPTVSTLTKPFTFVCTYSMWLPLTYHVCDLPAVSVLFHARLLFQGFWSFSVCVGTFKKTKQPFAHSVSTHL